MTMPHSYHAERSMSILHDHFMAMMTFGLSLRCVMANVDRSVTVEDADWAIEAFPWARYRRLPVTEGL